MDRMRVMIGLAGLALVCALGTSVWLVAQARHRAEDRALRATELQGDIVRVPAGKVAYRPLGNFSRNGKAATPGLVSIPVGTFDIMKYHVSRLEYSACVADGACTDVETGTGGVAQTNVNWIDATAYAAWLSEQTGETWRLPTVLEWHRAAAERQGDTAPDEGDLDPGERMLSQYQRGVFLRGRSSPALRPRGGFGENSLGIADMGGNVWEWTDGCMQNGEVGDDGAITSREPYCGVRIAGGRHQAAIIDFVRDANVGGCAVGLPPDHLGFRLVREMS